LFIHVSFEDLTGPIKLQELDIRHDLNYNYNSHCISVIVHLHLFSIFLDMYIYSKLDLHCQASSDYKFLVSYPFLIFRESQNDKYSANGSSIILGGRSSFIYISGGPFRLIEGHGRPSNFNLEPLVNDRDSFEFCIVRNRF